MTFNIWTFLFEILNFLVLAYILHRLLYRPLRNAIDERQAANARAQQQAEETRQAASKLQEELQKQRADLESERQQAIREARTQADTERQKLLHETEQTLRRHREEVHQSLDRERQEALRALRSEVVNQAIAVASRLVHEAADRTLQDQLTLRLVETLRALPEEEVQQLRKQWQPEDGAVLESAAMPDAATLDALNEAIAKLLARPVTPAIQTRPGLLAGVRLRLGGDVWDATLAGQLEPALSGDER